MDQGYTVCERFCREGRRARRLRLRRERVFSALAKGLGSLPFTEAVLDALLGQSPTIVSTSQSDRNGAAPVLVVAVVALIVGIVFDAYIPLARATGPRGLKRISEALVSELRASLLPTSPSPACVP